MATGKLRGHPALLDHVEDLSFTGEDNLEVKIEREVRLNGNAALCLVFLWKVFVRRLLRGECTP